MDKKLILLDLEAASTVDAPIECAYLYHPDNDGLKDLREIAAFALFCRHCEDKPCVIVCGQDALEKQDDSSVVRHNLRCVACGSCVAACPFGVISPDIVSYISARCDQCAELSDDEPPCIKNAPDGVLQWVDSDSPILSEPDTHVISDRLAVRCTRWNRAVTEKKE